MIGFLFQTGKTKQYITENRCNKSNNFQNQFRACFIKHRGVQFFSLRSAEKFRETNTTYHFNYFSIRSYFQTLANGIRLRAWNVPSLITFHLFLIRINSAFCSLKFSVLYYEFRNYAIKCFNIEIKTLTLNWFSLWRIKTYISRETELLFNIYQTSNDFIQDKTWDWHLKKLLI